ncbi:MAG TPA: HisA/HisF-related TIM barrel protein [Candidatus Limnocylindrales bacterium]|nr:HisA/HisF-related TIM barrel protein [Candidatus Limnocylindrales bacterium]
MIVIPSIDLQTGRSRLVFWPGAASGTGTPTDRPEMIARHFVGLGAAMLHLVDLDGATRGAPANTDAIQKISRSVAVPLQLAGGVDGPEQIELAFAAGATRVVVPMWKVADSMETLRACLRVGGDWLAVGVDARSERLRDYPWRGAAPTFDQLVAMIATEGVRRIVVSHWTGEHAAHLGALGRDLDLEVQLAGGVTDAAGVETARASGAHALIVGEALFTGGVDYAAVAAPLATAGHVGGDARG